MRLCLAFVLLAAASIPAPLATAQTRLLRFPDLHGDDVVFVHGGDLWISDLDGERVRRLTTHPGLELFPRFSPDGEWVAFTGQIDGDEQVYVIPRAGGAPRQLTWYPAQGPLPDRWGYDHQVLGWTPDSEKVLFRSYRHAWTFGLGRVWTVAFDGGLPEPLPMPQAGPTAFSPDGTKVFYSPLFRDFRTWKRYQGGWAQDLYVFDLATHELTQVTDHERTDRDPMWTEAGMFFTSDRSGTLELYRYDPDTGAITALTESEWDVRWPAAAPDGRIVFEQAGTLHVLDPRSRERRDLEIRVPTDDLIRRPERVSAAELISGWSLSPEGRRALFAARGDVFSVPAEHGPTRNLTETPGEHDKHPSWSPDGRQVAFVSDRSGEEQVWLVAQDGSGEPRQLTTGLTGMLYEPRWSPDATRIAISDKDGVLRVVEVETGAVTQVADEARGQLRDHEWSPCGTFLAFTLSEPSEMRSVWVWSAEDGETRRVTGPLTHETSPSWSTDGERLFFLGARSFAPRIGSFEWNYQVDRETEVFALALRAELPPLLPPRSDEAEILGAGGAEPEEPADAEAAEDAEGEPSEAAPQARGRAIAPITIDWDGLAGRVERIPVQAGNYAALTALGERLLWMRTPAFYYGRSPAQQSRLEWYHLEEREHDTGPEDVAGYTVSADREKLMLRQGSSWWLLDAAPGAFEKKRQVSTDELEVVRVPVEEWAQIFDEVWRRFRDFFYAPNMHGHDWQELGEQYRALLPHVSHRSDLNYLIGEMIAELNVGHAYISGGDLHRPERPEVGLPGAVLELDRDAGRYRIAELYHGDNTTERYRAPLTEVGVDAREGDYVLAIDGEELRPGDNPYRLLRARHRHPVRLTLNDRPSPEGAREVSFRPRTSERELAYWDWVATNRDEVAAATGGEVGYLHLPDMGADGLQEFIRWYYPQVRKKGLVVDVRHNGGGNVSQMLIERLGRELLMMGYGRTTGPSTYPDVTFHGHMVCLLNENSASDGDIFPAMFRRAGLGPLVGKRSWGGIIGITDRGTLIDGGSVHVPEFAHTEPGAGWTIEGVGVQPDVVVENPPAAEIAGRDPQLERATEIVLERITAEPRTLPARPADPVRR